MKGAFNADAAAKAAVRARLVARIGAGTLVAELMRHGEAEASWAGELAQGSDAARLPAMVGIPAGIGLLVDQLLMALSREPDERNAVALGLIDVIAPGADLGPVAPAMALAMLDDAALAPLVPADLSADLRDLHRRQAGGEDIARAQWAALRKVGMGNPLIEAAAWPMATSRAGLIETFNAAANLLGDAALAATGWGEPDEKQMRETFDAIAADHADERAAGTPIDFGTLLAQRAPDLVARRSTAYAAHWDARADFARRLAGRLHAALAQAQPALIPLADLFGLPARFALSISPSGQWLAWLAPRDGVANIWVAPRDRPGDARPVTAERGRDIFSFAWAMDDRTLLFDKDDGGNEIFHVHGADRETGVVRDLTPLDGARCGLAGISSRHPGVILATSYARNPHFPDLLRIDLASGAITTIEENDRFSGFLCDSTLAPVVAREALADGGAVLHARRDGLWHALLRIDADDARVSHPAGVSADGATLFLLDSRNRDTAALFALDLASGERRLLAQDERADIAGVQGDQQTWWPLFATAQYMRSERLIIDAAVAPVLAFLDQHLGRDWALTSRSMDDRIWIVSVKSDTRPGQAWVLDRAAMALDLLYETRPELADAPLMPMHDVVIPARDGLAMVSYLTLPAQAAVADPDERPAVAPPMVLLVHGGPWARDSFGYNPEVQWLANRGYAVLCVNFRGSTGFGKRHLSAGYGEWGGSMAQDLDDAVAWAIDRGFADAARLAIMGASYGGYATLRAMTTRPEMYACGVDIVGPANLETLMAAIPPWWESERAFLHNAVGNPAQEQGLARLRAHSPVHSAQSLKRPLLIGQGANDPRVLKAEADQIASALQANGITPNYVLFPDEGHGFARPANDMAFRCAIEAFLAAHLGGQVVPPVQAHVAGNTMQVISGEPWLHDLAEGLQG